MSNYNSGPYYGNYLYNEGMNLEELTPAELDLYIDQGDTYAKHFVIRDEWGVPINLSGLSISATMHRYYGSGTSYALIPTVTDATNGKIRLDMASIELTSFAISTGGKTRKHGPSFALGQSINVSSVPGLSGRHLAGIWTRRFSSTPC